MKGGVVKEIGKGRGVNRWWKKEEDTEIERELERGYWNWKGYGKRILKLEGNWKDDTKKLELNWKEDTKIGRDIERGY